MVLHVLHVSLRRSIPGNPLHALTCPTASLSHHLFIIDHTICSTTYDYQLISKCTGHSGCIEHIDWTLPISVPGTKLHGKMILMAVDESKVLKF